MLDFNEITCPNCNYPQTPKRFCPNCGYKNDDIPFNDSFLKYYKIVGYYINDVIGICTSLGLDGVKEEEPDATLIEITKEEYNKLNSAM